ncbi:hypothetical protein ACGFNU_00220 [Spirillospora sp. NPDC048911]|uniref:hypothetical protein n=1 Tax=Spirillospora sp. NPDC048911 TaxID=3364527 RepID=UPI003714287B
MAPVLTEAETITCSHQGTVVAKIHSRALVVAGAAVLTKADLQEARIDGCKPPPSVPPCASVLTIDDGVSGKLFRGGDDPVLLVNAKGTTNSGTWQAVGPGQTKLEAQ